MEKSPEQKAYERLHETRDSHIEERRRARDYQAKLALDDRNAFWVGAFLGAVGTALSLLICAVILAIWAMTER